MRFLISLIALWIASAALAQDAPPVGVTVRVSATTSLTAVLDVIVNVTLTASPRSSGDSEVRSRSRAFASTADERTSCDSVSRLTGPVVRPLATSVSVPTGWTRTLAVDVYC